MFNKPFKSTFVGVIDNTLKMTWLATVLIITNFAIIVNKINELNHSINANLVIIILLALFIITMFIVYWIDWKITRISYEDDVITVYKNLVFKDKYEFCVNKISSIIVEQNIFEKLFKVSKLRIYTNAKNKYKEDMYFIVKKKDAIEFRDKVFKDLFNSNDVDLIEEEKYDVKYSLKNILFHSICNISVTYMVIVVNVILLIFTMINDGSIVKEIMHNLLGFLITIFAIVLPVLYSIVTSVLKYCKFKLKKNEKALIIEFGLFNSKSYIVPINSINGFTITETLLSRIFGAKSLKIICAGISNKKSELPFLIPMSSNGRIEKVINHIFPELEYTIKTKINYQPDAVNIISILLIIIFDIVFFIVAQNLGLSILYTVGGIAISFLLIAIIYYFKRIRIKENYISISSGFILKKISIVLYNRIKLIKVSQGPLSKIFNMYLFNVYIMAGFFDSRHSLGYLKSSKLYDIRNKIPI
ncbi:MAG: PH domain-containing protein [Clostridia bacterium]|nr:PH domain-containing protein [Clostridia bacterium]